MTTETHYTRAAEPLHVEFVGVSKRFGSLQALSEVSFAVPRGSVHCILGENGAGKSTLMNVLFGLVQPDQGELRVDGRAVHVRSALDARALRIGMVHQHFKLVPSLTVAENILLGQERVRGLFIDRARAEREVAELSQRYGLAINPKDRVENLSVGLRQRVEILKSLSYGAELLILDEPTAVLTPQEAEALFAVVAQMRSLGKTILLITHKVHEVMKVGDSLSVLRRGRLVATQPAQNLIPGEISTLMVGREVSQTLERPPQGVGAVVLKVGGLSARSEQGREVLAEIGFELRRGEILGIAGVEGNGQTELVEALAGLLKINRGSLTLDGQEVSRHSPRRRREAGLAHIPEDRLDRGVSPGESVAANMTATHLAAPRFARGGLLNLNQIRRWVGEQIRRYDVRGGGAETPMRSLSGGNMQKVVLARELESDPKVLLAAQPTRGLDVGATEFVHRALLAARQCGCGVLLVSADLDEVLKLSDRIVVMYKGRMVGELEAGADPAEVGLYMTGLKGKEPVGV